MPVINGDGDSFDGVFQKAPKLTSLYGQAGQREGRVESVVNVSLFRKIASIASRSEYGGIRSDMESPLLQVRSNITASCDVI